MLKAQSLLNKVHDHKLVIDVGINAEIKTLQKKLVELSFTEGNNSSEYYWIMEEIKNLRKKIVQGVSK